MVAVSPDGRRLALAVAEQGGSRLRIRSLDNIQAQPLVGTEGAVGFVVWSPDSRFVAFAAQGKLKKIDALGAGSILCDVGLPFNGASWNRDGTIIFAPPNSPIMRVSASGGAVAPVTKLDTARRETAHASPWFLPDGRRFLYYSESRIFLGSLDSLEKQALITADSKAVFVSPGYLLFARQQTLMAQAFDSVRAALSGDPFPIVQQIGKISLVGSGAASFSASDAGVLAYGTGDVALLTR